MELVWVLLVLIGLIGLGLPIAFALVAVSIGILALADVDLLVVAQRLYRGVQSFPLLAVPLFILAGQIMSRSGISGHLVDFAKTLVGQMRGGLAAVNVVTSMFFAGMSGTSMSDTAAVGGILINPMIKRGFRPGVHRRGDRRLLDHRNHHSTERPDGHPRRVHGDLDRCTVCRRHRVGAAARPGPDPRRMGHLDQERLSDGGAVQPARARGRVPPGDTGADDAGHHPRRYPRRHLHAHRGIGCRGGLRHPREHALLPHPDAEGAVRDVHGGRGP